VAAASTASTVAWITIVVLLADRGLGRGNEGFYLLSYEYWDRNLRTFTGAQYLFGPLFDLTGQNVAVLRVVRLALMVAIHIFFGVSFARWLRLRRPLTPPGPLWEYAVASVIVAAGAITYGWLPPTPGYNDVTLLGSMSMVALLLVSLRALDLGRPASLWAWVAWGFVAGMMVLAKPPVVVITLLLAAASAYALRRSGGRMLRPAVGVVTGVVLFVVVVQVLVMSWADIVPPMREELGVVSSSTHSPLDTLLWYAASMLNLLKATLLVCAPTALAAGVARVLRRQLSTGRRTAVLLLGLAASLALLAGAGGLRAGDDNVLAYTSGIAAMVLLVIASTAVDHRALRRGSAATVDVILLLALVPPLQGFGTNNAIYAVAVNGAAFWVALMIFLVSRAGPRPAPRHALGVAATSAAVVLAVVVGVDGTIHDGAGRPLLTEPMARVVGSHELSTIGLPSAEASRLIHLRDDLGIGPGTHRPMLAYGELAQYVLILSGRPIGSAWYSNQDDGLNPADLRAACRHGNPWGDEQPLVVASRAPSQAELNAWRSCGIDFEHDYADVTPPSAPDGIRILRWTGPTVVPDSSTSG
jgi:hypothetical protein